MKLVTLNNKIKKKLYVILCTSQYILCIINDAINTIFSPEKYVLLRHRCEY